MPDRDPPFFILQAHEVRLGDEMDVDWTLSGDWEKESRLREERNKLIKQQLAEGKTVAYRSSGWSLFPKVHSGDLCSYIPVRFEEQVVEDNVVFCQPQPKNYYYAHNVQRKEWDYDHGKYKFWIANMRGRINGWCFIEHIYGKLVEVLH